MNWTKLEPIKGSTACLTCGCGAHDVLNPDRLLGVGFGDVNVMKDGKSIYSELETMRGHDDDPEPPLWLCSDAEKEALKDPYHDWRIHFYAPLYEAEYQRQGDNHWVLVRKGEGFA